MCEVCMTRGVQAEMALGRKSKSGRWRGKEVQEEEV
jgi:hypothetical protein